ncbi:hypothetical protein D3C81_1811170 [compost metagenome]
MLLRPANPVERRVHIAFGLFDFAGHGLSPGLWSCWSERQRVSQPFSIGLLDAAPVGPALDLHVWMNALALIADVRGVP